MAEELKRVGLVFKEEGAVDFRKTLQEINIELSKNYNQFKLSQSQWDNSTKSTEKLKAQQEYLTNAYEIQADKVNTLKMQLSELESAENKNVTAIKKKQNELTNAEIKLKNYEEQLEKVNNKLSNFGQKITEAGTKIEKTGKNIEDAGKKLSAFSAASVTALGLSAKSAIDFEEAFTGVEKTVDGTSEQLNELKQGIRDLAKEIPSSTTEISAVAEAAGQLGIKTEDILDFTKVMIDLGNSTNLSAEEAASSLAKFANVTKMSAKDYDRLGSTIVALGNNFATTEADIVAMATRLAATGELAGLSESQILAMATAMSSVGIEAEAGGSAMSKLLKNIQVAVETGGEDLKDFAKVAGMTSKEFKNAFEKDAVSALSAFISGLNDTKRNGKSAISILNDMDLTEVRLSNTILSLANASDVMSNAVKIGNEAWEDNTALTNEANKRYDTLKSKISILINKVKDIAITIGNKLMPTVEKIVNRISDWTERFSELNEEQVDTIVKIGLVVAAISPLLTILGKITSTIGGTIKSIGTFTQAIGVIRGTVSTTSTAVNGLASTISAVASPVGIAVTAIGTLAGAYIYLKNEAEKLPPELQRISEETKKAKQEHEEYRAELDKTASSSLAEMQNLESLRNELSKLVDENGKVQEGYEDRVTFILNELKESLGIEYSLTGDVINQYKELQSQIDLLILKKKAQIILQNEEEKYTNAIKNQNEAYQDMIDAQEQYNNALKGMTYEEYFEKLKQNYIDAGYTEKKAVEHAKNYMAKWVDGYKEAYETSKKIYNDYVNDIATYENDYTVIESNNTEEIKRLTDERINNYSREKMSKEEQVKNSIEQEIYNINELKKLYEEDLKNQNKVSAEAHANAIKSGEARLKNLTENLIAQTSTINENSPEIIDSWKKLATSSYDTYNNEVSKLPAELRNKIEQMTGVFIEQTPEITEEAQNMGNEIIKTMQQSDEFKKEALNNLQAYLQGLSDEQLRNFLKEAGMKDVDKVIQGIRDGNLGEEEGTNILASLYKGLNNYSWKDSIYQTARGIASNLSSLLSIKANVTGANLAFSAATASLPGHKSGLDYVPKDNYVARLHKGERVLTAEENEEYTRAEEQIRQSSNSQNSFVQEIDYSKMANAFLSALNKCKLSFEEDGIARIVKDELYKVV